MNVPAYIIVRRPRRRTASITISPDRTIRVVVPAFLQDGEIARLIDKKQTWINNKLAELDGCMPPAPAHQYRQGETFPFLGDRLLLRITTGSRADITLSDTDITVSLPPHCPPQSRLHLVRTTLTLWYTRMAMAILSKKTQQFAERCGVRPPGVGVKEYRSRWGCCFSDGRIYYNWKIIGAPEPIVDYVVVHELCHLRQPDHSSTYWQIVTEILPDWQERRRWLKKNGHTLQM